MDFVPRLQRFVPKGNMTEAPDQYGLLAEVTDLSRRIAILEALYLGTTGGVPTQSALVGLYWDACKGPVFDKVTARHWERQFFTLDSRGLLILARAIRDPTPWHPFLLLLDRYIEEGFELETCRQHVLSVAQDLLNIQGMKKINPRHVLGNQLRVKAILSAISRRGRPNAQKADP